VKCKKYTKLIESRTDRIKCIKSYKRNKFINKSRVKCILFRPYPLGRYRNTKNRNENKNEIRLEDKWMEWRNEIGIKG